MLRDLGQTHTIMLSSHLLTEVESLVQRVIIIRRGHLGLARKLSELENDDVMVVEVRGPVEQVAVALRTIDGVAQVTPAGPTTARRSLRCARSSSAICASRFCQRVAKNAGRCAGSICAAAGCRIAGTRSTTGTTLRRRGETSRPRQQHGRDVLTNALDFRGGFLTAKPR